MTDRDVVVSTAKRRMLRRLRSHWRHEQFSIRMALASAAHHSHMRVANTATQTDFVLAATYAATALSSARATPVPPDAPAPVIKYVSPTPDATTVTEYIAPARVAPTPQASSGFVTPQFSVTSVETSASQIVGAFRHLEGSAVPVNLTYQEQIVAGETDTLRNFIPCRNK